MEVSAICSIALGGVYFNESIPKTYAHSELRTCTSIGCIVIVPPGGSGGMFPRAFTIASRPRIGGLPAIVSIPSLAQVEAINLLSLVSCAFCTIPPRLSMEAFIEAVSIVAFSRFCSSPDLHAGMLSTATKKLRLE